MCVSEAENVEVQKIIEDAKRRRRVQREGEKGKGRIKLTINIDRRVTVSLRASAGRSGSEDKKKGR